MKEQTELYTRAINLPFPLEVTRVAINLSLTLEGIEGTRWILNMSGGLHQLGNDNQGNLPGTLIIFPLVAINVLFYYSRK